MNTVPSCDMYDYLEIACMFRYEVKLQLTDGKEAIGMAKTLGTNAKKQETLYLEDLEQALEVSQIFTGDIVSMTVLTPDARFQEVAFKSA